MRRFFHPRDRQLSAWLHSGNERLDRHVDTCERCAARIEVLGGQPLSTDTGSAALGDALVSVLAPPPDLQPRLRAGINRKMQEREDLRLLAEMLGIPLRTIRSLREPPQDPDASSAPNT